MPSAEETALAIGLLTMSTARLAAETDARRDGRDAMQKILFTALTVGEKIIIQLALVALAKHSDDWR